MGWDGLLSLDRQLGSNFYGHTLILRSKIGDYLPESLISALP